MREHSPADLRAPRQHLLRMVPSATARAELLEPPIPAASPAPEPLPEPKLQRLADETGLALEVCHYPSRTLKWNKIEHNMFCHN